MSALASFVAPRHPLSSFLRLVGGPTSWRRYTRATVRAALLTPNRFTDGTPPTIVPFYPMSIWKPCLIDTYSPWALSAGLSSAYNHRLSNSVIESCTVLTREASFQLGNITIIDRVSSWLTMPRSSPDHIEPTPRIGNKSVSLRKCSCWRPGRRSVHAINLNV